MSHQPVKVLVDTVVKLERRGAQKSLRKILNGTRPADLARLIRFLPEPHRAKILRQIEDIASRAEVLTEIEHDVLPSILEQLSDDELARLLEEMVSDDAVDVLALLDDERKERLLGLMRREDMHEAELLLRFDPESAGGIMSPDFFSLGESVTVAEAIEFLQTQGSDLEMAFYLYVTNDHDHLVGVVSLRQLVISPPDRPLAEIMEPDVVRVKTSDDREAVSWLVARYNLLALPVVDDSNRLVGIVTVDDVIDVIREEATEDMFRMAGAGDAPIALDASGVLQSIRSRLPWLFASWIGGIGASFIIHGFEEQLAKVALMAAFIPVIIGMGGNIGTQSLTIVTRGLALGQLQADQLLRVVSRELLVGLACGAFYGILLGGVGALVAHLDAENLRFGDPLSFGLTITVSLCAAMVIAAVVGSSVPMLFQRLSIDPAVATGPFVTTAVDVLGVLVYFASASVLLGI